MGEACFIIPTCRNKEGKDVESKLFEDLWHYSGNYEWAEKQYKIATDQGFLDSVSLDAVFDKNGQITAKSFMDLTGVTFTSDEIKEKLSKRWGDASLPAEKVPNRVSEFNAQEELKDDFIPVVEEQEGEVVKFTISKRNPERVAALQEFIENNEVLKVVSQRLKDLGVAYDFVGERNRYKGRFSTKNATKAFDGLYHLIEIAQGAPIEETLLEESAHLATLACKDSVFINRLLNAINENTVSRLFSEEELQGVDLSSKDAKLELAGKLVAKAMKNEATAYNGLLGNIKRAINRLFAKTNLSSLLSAKVKAQVMAERLAHGFLFEEDFDVQEALKTPAELYFSEPITEESKALKQTLDEIKKLGGRVKTFSKVAYDSVYKKLTEKAVLGEEDYTTIDAQEAVALTSSAVDELLSRLILLSEPLSMIDEKFFNEELSTDAINAVYEADSVLMTLETIKNVYRKLSVGPIRLESTVTDSIDSILNRIDNVIPSAAKALNKYKVLYSVQLMREFCGKDVIDLAADVQTKAFFDPVRFRDKRSYSMSDVVQFYNDEISDNSAFITFFRTYSNHRDITTQAFYNIVRRAKAKEAIDYNSKIADLAEIEKDWKAFLKTHPDFTTTDLYEMLDDGSFTGYFISDVKRGQLHQDREDVIRKAKKAFLEALESEEGYTTSDGLYTLKLTDFKRLTKAQRYNLFKDFIFDYPPYQEFEDSVYLDKDSKIYSDKYIDHDFIAWCKEYPEFKELYDRITQYKQSIDSEYLTDITDTTGGACHGVLMRIPQFKASLIGRLANKKYITDQDLYDARNVKEYCEDVTSDAFGSPLTEDISLEGQTIQSAPDVRKLALYGINLLDNKQDLTTDIFKALDLYTEMACRFHTSQAVASRLELFHSQLSQRELTPSVTHGRRGENRGVRVKSIASEKREDILRNFVYARDDFKFDFRNGDSWKELLNRFGKKVIGVLGAFGAIRALCFSPIAGLKNYIAGYRVFAQDVAAGLVEDVTLKDVVKATWQNWSPKHFIGEMGRVLYGGTISFDQYQKLIDRWDSYRTPSKIHRKRGFHPLQTLINVAMANYSVTDNALVGTIYYSRMNNVKLYDTETEKFVPASKCYKWVNSNPQIKDGLLKDAKDARKYKALTAAIKSIEDIIENNNRAEEDDNLEIMRLSDSTELAAMEDLFDENGYELPEIRNRDGGYKSADEVLRVLMDASKQLCFTEEDEFNICSNINDYIISSQGVYGMLNATEFQSNVYTQSLGKIKGYMFGMAQRNFFTNYRASNNKVNHALFESVRLALWSVFSGAKELSARGDISPAKYRACALAMIMLPPALRSKECQKHMERCGWDKDQLEKLTCACLGWIINFSLGLLARALYRGNEKAIGDKVYKNKGKMPLDEAALDGAIALFTGQKYSKLIKPGILFPEEGRSVDAAKAMQQYENWAKDTRNPRYPKNMRDASAGSFIPGTEEFNDRVASYTLKNTIYNTQDPMYYMAGFFYRLTRGVRDEGVTLMNPLRFANDVIDMFDFGNSILFSSGIGFLVSGVDALLGNDVDWEKFHDRETNFYLNKFGLSYDGTPDPGMDKIQLIDWYGKQDKIDRYQEQERSLPQPWN